MICTKGEILEKHYRNYKKRIAYEENVFNAMDEYAKQESSELLKACKKMKEELPRAVSIGGDKKFMKLLDAWQDITQAIKKAQP